MSVDSVGTRAFGKLARTIRRLMPEEAANPRSCWSDQPAPKASADAKHPLSRLARLEADLATAIRRHGSVADAQLTPLVGWLERNLTPEGLLRIDPWRTGEALAPIARMQIAAGAHWPTQVLAPLRRLVLAVVRLLTGSGSLQRPTTDAVSVGVLEHCLVAANLPEWKGIARGLLMPTAPRRGPKPIPPFGIQSDAGRLAVLRRDWSRLGAILGLDHRTSAVTVDWRLFDQPLVQGPWTSQLQVAGKSIAVDGEWDCVSWQSTEFGDYLELKLELGKGLTIDRQLYLARPISLLWMSDTVKAAKPGVIDYQWRLPLASTSARLRAVPPTRAQSMDGLGYALRVLPVGAPANPLLPDATRLRLEDQQLVIGRSVKSDRLFLPLAWTWHVNDLGTTADWRQLTVTNDRRPVPADEAVAYRVAHQDHQLIFFRGLKQRRRLAFIGHQTYSECEFLHLDADAKYHEWMLVDWPGRSLGDAARGQE